MPVRPSGKVGRKLGRPLISEEDEAMESGLLEHAAQESGLTEYSAEEVDCWSMQQPMCRIMCYRASLRRNFDDAASAAFGKKFRRLRLN